jgi:hypothetical protein
MHDTASGQDFCGAGAAGPCSSGQQGIPSGMDIDCMSFVPADMRIIAVAPCDAATGATKRPTTARIDDKRWKKVRSFTISLCHMLPHKEKDIFAHITATYHSRGLWLIREDSYLPAKPFFEGRLFPTAIIVFEP